MRYRRVATENVTLDHVDMTLDDLDGVDAQIRCVLGDIEEAYKEKGYTDFEIIVRGRK